MTDKARISVTVDPEVVAAGREAVSRGEAPSFSAWVNAALRQEADRVRRLAALDEAIAAYEAENGVITDEEMEAAERWARERAIVVRGPASQAGAA
jgi:Arc/MetJ-type ribon-helix-helix transcriptional regulator